MENLNGKEGICPYCGSNDISYGVDFSDKYNSSILTHSVTCSNCKKEFTEEYYINYKGSYGEKGTVEEKEYTLTWKINIGGFSPEVAVKEAMEIMRDPDSTATIFSVKDNKTGKEKEIDYLDILKKDG